MARKNVIRALAGTACVLLVAGAAGPGAAAVTMEDSGDVQATVRKTVLQTATATGEILTSRMYTQVSAVGNGTKTVLVPVGTTSNRNLNEFGAFPMEGESIQFDLTVDGGAEERTLTDADINPMEVSVKVTLDGVEIQPEDVVGANGVLDVQYTVRNTTATTSPVTYADVEGTEITEDLETADPYVGSLDVTLPQGFNEVTAPGATIAGNGQNQTSLGFTFVLFPPLGSPEVTVGYQARIDGGVMPPADFSFLPIVPFDNSTIAGTTDAYRGGAATGAQIFGAGTEIGDNLLLLQDGASQLVSGLGQLAAGATQLSDGLVNTAAPGSAQLADGADQLSDGLNQLNSQVPALEDGVSDLNSGAQSLNSGAVQVSDGNAELAAGIASLDKGINLLSQGVAALPESITQNAGYKQLQAALSGVQTAIDQKFIPGINQLEKGLDNADATDPGFKQVLGALYQKLYNTDPAEPGARQALESIKGALGPTPPGVVPSLPIGGVQTIIKQVMTDLGCDPATTLCALVNGPAPLQGKVYAYLNGALQTIGNDTTDPTVLFGLTEIIAQIGNGSPPASASDEPTATYAINALIAGIGSKSQFPPADPTKPPETLLYGLEALKAGLSNPNCKSTDPQNATNPCGVKEIQGLVAAGINQLVAGISQELLKNIGTSPAAKGCDPTKTLTCASAALTAGSAELASGAAQLADGTDQLASGTKQLDANVPTLASGVQQLDDGGTQVADGANQLADGLGAAADGSEQLVDGLSQAEPGGAQIEQGAGDLKEQGADVLAQTGKDAQIDYARNVALLEASQQAGLEGAGIPFGSAVGTDVVTTAAVQMQLAGIAPDTENNALKFGLGALLIAGAGGAAFAAARKVAA